MAALSSAACAQPQCSCWRRRWWFQQSLAGTTLSLLDLSSCLGLLLQFFDEVSLLLHRYRHRKITDACRYRYFGTALKYIKLNKWRYAWFARFFLRQVFFYGKNTFQMALTLKNILKKINTWYAFRYIPIQRNLLFLFFVYFFCIFPAWKSWSQTFVIAS